MNSRFTAEPPQEASSANCIVARGTCGPLARNCVVAHGTCGPLACNSRFTAEPPQEANSANCVVARPARGPLAWICRATAAALLLLAALLAGHAAAAACSCPPITRAKMIDLAKSGVGSPYVWGGTCWDPANRHAKGADCSGYVTKCWQIPGASAVTSCTAHTYNTGSYLSSSTHWSAVSRSSMLAGDALTYNSGSQGHIVLFEAYTKTSGCYEEYEARGSAYGIMHRVKCPDASYQARRRHNIVTPPPPPPPPPPNTPPKGNLDAADCAQIAGWAQDPDVKTSAIAVRVFVDSVPGQAGAVYYTVKADQNRPDLAASLGSTNHGYALATPAKHKDGKTHTIRVFALDSTGGTNPELSGSPKKITCARPPGEAGPDPLPDDAGGPAGPEAGPPAATDLGATGDSALEIPHAGPEDGEMQGGCAQAPAAAPRGAAVLALALLALVGGPLARRASRRSLSRSR